MKNELQKQYEGYNNTPLLWSGELEGIRQFDHTFSAAKLDAAIKQNVRLGHLVEQFLRFDLERSSRIELIAHNVQINDEIKTLGEFDFILRQADSVKIIESAYKFYLYDPEENRNQIAPWIGPNRKDSLHNKLHKIKQHQFKLVETSEAKMVLESLIANESPICETYFKAQLYIPFQGQNIDFKQINKACVSGFYSRLEEFIHLKDHKFIHLSNKHDWLVKPYEGISWKRMDAITQDVKNELERKNSPLLWIKRPNGDIYKSFLVWW